MQRDPIARTVLPRPEARGLAERAAEILSDASPSEDLIFTCSAHNPRRPSGRCGGFLGEGVLGPGTRLRSVCRACRSANVTRDDGSELRSIEHAWGTPAGLEQLQHLMVRLGIHHRTAA